MDTESDVQPTKSLPAAAPTTAATAGASGGMRSIVDELVGGTPLGDTEAGKAWCLKALHPADTNVLSSPMPTNETKAFASVAFQQMDVLSMPSTFDPAKPWSIDIFVFRWPTILYSWRAHQVGAADVIGKVYSRQYGSNTGTELDAYNDFRGNVEKYRLTSQSLTGYFDASSLSDQGHVVVGQSDLPFMKMSAMMNPAPTYDVAGQVPWAFYQDPPPAYDNILQTTRAYQAHASEGFYVPSKLQSLGRWIRTNDVLALLGSATSNPAPPPPEVGLARLGIDSVYADQKELHTYGTFPYFRKDGTEPVPFVFEQVDSSISSIFYTGLAATSTIRATARWTMDMIVRSGTVYAPFVRMPPVEDPMALRMYAEVSRRMADAYPSSANNFGAILGAIGRIATTVLPQLAPSIFGWLQGKAAHRAAQQTAGETPDAPSFMEQLMTRFGTTGVARTRRQFDPITGAPVLIAEPAAAAGEGAIAQNLGALIDAFRGRGSTLTPEAAAIAAAPVPATLGGLMGALRAAGGLRRGATLGYTGPAYRRRRLMPATFTGARRRRPTSGTRPYRRRRRT